MQHGPDRPFSRDVVLPCRYPSKRIVPYQCKAPVAYSRNTPFPNNGQSWSRPVTDRAAVVSAVYLFQLGSGPRHSSCACQRSRMARPAVSQSGSVADFGRPRPIPSSVSRGHYFRRTRGAGPRSPYHDVCTQLCTSAGTSARWRSSSRWSYVHRCVARSVAWAVVRLAVPMYHRRRAL
jgi:hypothetical protein